MSEEIKSRYATSEFWLSMITTGLSLVMFVVKDGNALAWASGIAAFLSAGVYALFQTKLPSENPGWKSKAFWTAMVSVFGSMAVAVADIHIPGLPDVVTQIAAMIAAAVSAGGYTIHRRANKSAAQAKLAARLKG